MCAKRICCRTSSSDACPQRVELRTKLTDFLLESSHAIRQRSILDLLRRDFGGRSLHPGTRRRLAAEEVHVARVAPSRLAGQSRDERSGLALEQALQRRL